MAPSYPAEADALYRAGVPLGEIAARLGYAHGKSAHSTIWRYRRRQGMAPIVGKVGRPRTATVCRTCTRAIVGHARRGECGACASRRYRRERANGEGSCR